MRNSVPDHIPTDSRRYGNHLRRKRGQTYHYYCDNCGKHALTGGKNAVFPSKRIFCSKECENEYFPKSLVTIVSVIVLGAWALGLIAIVKELLR